MRPDDTKQQLQAAMDLNQAQKTRYMMRMFLPLLITCGLLYPILMVSIYLLPFAITQWMLLFTALLVSVGLAPNPKLLPLGRAYTTMDNLTPELRQTLALAEDSEERGARWAELSARMAAVHGAAFTAPSFTDAQRRLGATLAADRRLQTVLTTIPQTRAPRAWAGWERVITNGVFLLVAAVVVAVGEIFFGPIGEVVAKVVAVVCAHLTGTITFRALADTHLRRSAHGAVLEGQADALRAFLANDNDTDGAARLDRWLTLRTQHETQLIGWPGWFSTAKRP